MFAAISVIVFIKYYYENHFALRLIASVLLAFGVIEIGKVDSSLWGK